MANAIRRIKRQMRSGRCASNGTADAPLVEFKPHKRCGGLIIPHGLVAGFRVCTECYTVFGPVPSRPA